jgi:hypothetical protein
MFMLMYNIYFSAVRPPASIGILLVVLECSGGLLMS